MRRPSDTALAIGLSLVALTLFDVMGLIIKHLSPKYFAAELSAWRNLFGMIPSLIALLSSKAWKAQGRPVRLRQWWLPLLRGVAVSLAQLMFYLALGTLAFATATTITYANAIFVTALSVPMLGEKVGWVRWSAVLIGFAGVILVVGPGRDSFTLYALLPLGAAFLYAVSAVSARLVDSEVPSPLLNLHTQAIAAVSACALALSFGGFSPIAGFTDFLWILAMGACGGTAVLCLIIAYRMTEPSNLAPFSYFGIPLAYVLGWAVFDEAPFADLFPGALLIIAGGLLIVWRERRRKRLSSD